MTTTEVSPAVAPPRRRLSAPRAVAAWAAVVVVARLWGWHLMDQHVNIVLFAPPLLARPHLGLVPALLVPAATATLLVARLPIVARRLSWRGLLVATAGNALAWTVALALGEGFHGLTRGVADRTDYLRDVPFARAHVGAFLSHFTRDIAHFQIQTRGHPPGMVLLLAGMAKIDHDKAVILPRNNAIPGMLRAARIRSNSSSDSLSEVDACPRRLRIDIRPMS